MKTVLLAAIVCCTAIAYAQGGNQSSDPAPLTGAYAPHPLPAGMEAPPPIEQAPKDAFIRDPKLAAKLQKELLPDGPSIQDACDGFKHLGDCVCAIHVSRNLGVPLPDLKAKVTGKGAEKIENAIHELKPDVDAKAEKKKAWKQAEKEIPVSN